MSTTYLGSVKTFLRLVSIDRLLVLEDLIDKNRIFLFDRLPDDIYEDLKDTFMEDGYLHVDKKFQVDEEQFIETCLSTLAFIR